MKIQRVFVKFFCLFILSLMVSEAYAQTGLPLPRFVSLRAGEVNLRSGPDVSRYPIDWVYIRRGLPVEVIIEAGTWRKIRDWEGTVGWVHQSMLSNQRTIQAIKEMRSVHVQPSRSSAVKARVMPGAIGELKKCSKNWCLVNFSRTTGWMKKTDFWGAYPGEILDD